MAFVIAALYSPVIIHGQKYYHHFRSPVKSKGGLNIRQDIVPDEYNIDAYIILYILLYSVIQRNRTLLLKIKANTKCILICTLYRIENTAYL